MAKRGEKDARQTTSIIKNKSYKKSNQLINARGRGTLMSQKLFAIGMQHIRLDSSNHVLATITGSELCRIFGTNSGSIYTQIIDICNRSKSHGTIFDWSILVMKEDEQYLKATQVVTDAEYKNGVLTIRYNDTITPMLMNLKDNYTVLSLEETVRMKSIYSLRLSEILKSAYDREVAISKRSGEHVFEYPIIELKLSLGIVQIEGNVKLQKELSKDTPDYAWIEDEVNKMGVNKYQDFRDFNKSVIKIAVKEINEKTSIQVASEPVKMGKKTVAIRFFVNKKATEESSSSSVKCGRKQSRNLSTEERDRILDTLGDLMHDDFRTSEVRQICEYADYDEEKIREAYEYMTNYQMPIEVPIAFMKSAIKEGYQSTKRRECKTTGFKNSSTDYSSIEDFIVEG